MSENRRNAKSTQVQSKPAQNTSKRGPCPWLCNMVPTNVPRTEAAQMVLHPHKDVFVLKVSSYSVIYIQCPLQARIHCCGRDGHAHSPSRLVCDIYTIYVCPTTFPTPIYFINSYIYTFKTSVVVTTTYFEVWIRAWSFNITNKKC